MTDFPARPLGERSGSPLPATTTVTDVPADPVPSGREVIYRVTTATGDWQLQRRGSHYELICSGVFLMATYNRGSDRALATLALARIPGNRLRVLVGGLGIGFTAQAVLEDQRVQGLEIVEVEPVVTQWHREYFAQLCGRPLEDPRARLVERDFYEVPLAPASYDAILLDTDNGPDWLARVVNARLYQPAMIGRLVAALTSRGVLAIWSANPAPEFADLLGRIGQQVEAIETADEVEPGRQFPAWVYVVRPASPMGAS